MSSSMAPSRGLALSNMLCLLVLAGCDRAETSQVGSGAAQGTPAPRTAISATAPVSGLLDILAKWSAGEHDAAVAGVVALSQSPAGADALRLYAMTEQQFVKLPAERRAELQSEVHESLKHLRALARELRRRASEAATDGRASEADRLMDALRALVRANRGPEVFHAVEMVCKAIEEGLVAPPLGAAPETLPAGGSP